MPYTNSPEISTYKTETIKFYETPFYRDGNLTYQRDPQIINMFFDRTSNENQRRTVRLVKRPGLTTSSYILNKSSNSVQLRGHFYDVDQNAFYWAVDNKVYSVSPDNGTTVRTVTTLATSSGYVGFCSYLKSDDTRYVCFTDGTELWIDNYASVSCNKVTDADMPTPHQPYPVAIDGYLFLVESNSGNIWNSNVDDPTSWTAGSFIQAELSSDYVLRIAKAQNYLVALGYNSIEYFWDAGNAAPDSPLSRNDSPFRSIGYVSGLCTIGDTTYFVGQDEKKNIGVYSINNFKIDMISTSTVTRTLQTYSSTSNAKSNINSGQDGYSISISGKTFYVLVTPQTTWLYDVDDKFWYEWKDSSESGLKIEAIWAMYRGNFYVAIQNQGYISILSTSVYQDFGSNFTCQYTTDAYEFDTYNWKVCHKVTLGCSRHLSNGTSNITIQYNDDDWSVDGTTITRTLNVFSTSPFITNCGKFRSRSFRIKYSDNYPFFMSELKLNLNVLGV